jgi:adenylosuccinate synthase
MGPFPTELLDDTGDQLRKCGNEYGSTTGRPRRCGWLDLVALNYSIMINGATDLIMMKADVMDDFDIIKICIGYKINGEITTDFPYELNEKVEPVYIEMAGWKCDLTKLTSENDFPKQLKSYIKFIEEKTEVPISIVSVGPNREQTIIRKL